MNKVQNTFKWVLILICCAVAGLSPSDSSAVLTPIGPYPAEVLPEPNPPVFLYSSSIAYYNNYLIYAGSDAKIYGYNLATSESVPICDTSSLSYLGYSAVQGFLVSSDGYLYFHDNLAFPGKPQSIYRLQLSGPWPVPGYETLVTDTTSAIFAFTENPWTNTIWFSSSDFGGDNFYLYEIDAAFAKATLRLFFPKKDKAYSGNGPIIFEDVTNLLYGESVFGGDGYFHQVNTATGEVKDNYLTFSGGLGDATYGFKNRIFATSGGGKTIFELRGSADPLTIGTTDNEARGITFGDANFYVSEMGDDGKISLNKGWAEINPVNPSFRARALDDPNPPGFLYSSSIAYYNNYLIYASADGKIYGYNLTTSESVVISDTSLLGEGKVAIQGFYVSSDNYLYFHDNAAKMNVPQSIYRLQLSGGWPVDYEPLVTDATSAIFAFTENPWTNAIWFSSSDFFGGGNNFYLYEIDGAFSKTTLRSFFEKRHDSSGNGPIIFEDETTLLYGESVFGGNGYFHQVNTTTGDVKDNYLTFAGGLGDATYGYNNRIYVTSGGGKSIFVIDGTQPTLLATTYDEARGIIFDGTSLFISDMVPYSGSNDDGKIGLLELWPRVQEDQRVDDSVDLNADGISDNLQPDVILAVNTADGSGSKQIGISPLGTDVVVEFLRAVDASTIGETNNRPTDMPFDLINYRLKVNSPDGIAQVKVYLSEPAPAGAKWYKYDTIDGWIDYSAHATLSVDRKSVTLELKDGDYGDLDHVVNGEIVDPGGVGVTASPPLSSGGGGGGGGCFIESAGYDALKQHCTLSYLLFPVVLLLGIGIFVRLRRE